MLSEASAKGLYLAALPMISSAFSRCSSPCL